VNDCASKVVGLIIGGDFTALARRRSLIVWTRRMRSMFTEIFWKSFAAGFEKVIFVKFVMDFVHNATKLIP